MRSPGSPGLRSVQAALIAVVGLAAAALGFAFGRATEDPDALTATFVRTSTIMRTSTVTRTVTATQTEPVERVFVPVATGLEYKPRGFGVGVSNESH